MRASPPAAARRRGHGAWRVPPWRAGARPRERPRCGRVRAPPGSSCSATAPVASRTTAAARSSETPPLMAMANSSAPMPGMPPAPVARRTSVALQRRAPRMRTEPATRQDESDRGADERRHRVEPEEGAEPDRHEGQPSHQPSGACRLRKRDAHLVVGLLRIPQRGGERAQAFGERSTHGRRHPPGRRDIRPGLRTSCAATPACGGRRVRREPNRVCERSATRRGRDDAPGGRISRLRQVAPGLRRRHPRLQQHRQAEHSLCGPAVGLVHSSSHETSSIPSRPDRSRMGLPAADSRRTPSSPRSTWSTSPIALTT